VLYLAPWVDLGGSDKGTIDWFRKIDRTRWAPSLICTQPSPNRWLDEVEPYAEEIWDLPSVMAGGWFPGFILGFIESRGVRIVHNMNSRLGFDLLPDMAMLPRRPLQVVQMHAEEPERSGYVPYVTQRYQQVVDAFSLTSRHLAHALHAYEVPRSKLAVIHTGVDAIGEWDPAHASVRDLGPARHHVLWPARVVHQKDPLTAIEAAALLERRGLDFTLHMVGDGELAEPARGRAADLGIDHRIAWHPPAKHLADWYRSCDLVLMTSRFEGIPYVVYEALAMATPVVAPALPGNLELTDADSGRLVPVGAGAEEYADAIAELLADDDARAAAGARSRERMLREFSLEEMGRRHDELYERLLAEHRASGPARAASIPVPPPLALPRTPPPERSVAVIVPCHRHGAYLGRCLDSIEAQTHPVAEVVVVDDASPDPETHEALAAAEARNGVRVLRQEVNRGPGAARNRALDEVRSSYVLPLDADDELLPDAVERMLPLLESAPGDVGFVYPNQQYTGIRDDYVTVPAYNLALLRKWNYCAASSLFDRRVFDAVRYSEERAGHEDWNLVLALADRGVRGVPAEGPTFLYRKLGFSLLTARLFESDDPEKVARRHFPRLFDPRSGVKPRWAPALSLILLGEGWPDDVPGEQTCADFEVVRSPADAHGLATALGRARGRWVLVAEPPAAPALGARVFVEHVLRTFLHSGRVFALALVDHPAAVHRFAPVEPPLGPGARLAAVAWERAGELGAMPAELGVTASLLEDLLLALQGTHAVDHRSVRRRAA